MPYWVYILQCTDGSPEPISTITSVASRQGSSARRSGNSEVYSKESIEEFLQSRSRNTVGVAGNGLLRWVLYTGITNNLERRIEQHKNKKGGAYTRAHKAIAIVHTEQFPNRSKALKREAEIKKWRREKKLQFINQSSK